MGKLIRPMQVMIAADVDQGGAVQVIPQSGKSVFSFKDTSLYFIMPRLGKLISPMQVMIGADVDQGDAVQVIPQWGKSVFFLKVRRCSFLCPD